MAQQTKSQKVRLGAFVILSVLILIVALYFIGNRQNMFGKTVRITAVFKNVNGLMLGNNVRFSGINIGTVKKIEMINDTTICVDMVIETNILKHLKKNVFAAISSDGLVGSMVLDMVPRKGNAAPLAPGDTIQSISKISTNDMLSTLSNTNENAALLTLDLLKITNKINSGKGTFDLLMSDETMATDLKAIILNLKSASSSANKTINELNRIVQAVNYNESTAAVLLSDPDAAKTMKSLIGNLESSAKGIDSVIKNLNEIVGEVQTGNGPLNAIITDTLLTQNINGTLKNLEEGSSKLNENLEALKHSFLLKGYFRKIEKEKEKESKK